MKDGDKYIGCAFSSTSFVCHEAFDTYEEAIAFGKGIHHASKDLTAYVWPTDDREIFEEVPGSAVETFLQVLKNESSKAKPARLDTDKTAKPLTSIGIKLDPYHCFYGVKAYHDPQLVNNETGETIPLYRK